MRRFFGALLGSLLVAAIAYAAAGRFTTIQLFDRGLKTSSIEPDPDTLAMTIGSSSVTSITVTTGDTGNTQVVLPGNSVGGAEMAAPIMNVIFCGELAENGTTYLGPSTAQFGGNGADLGIGTAACDALDNTTESSADAPLFTNVAFKVMGFYCKTDGTLGASETIIFTMRTAEGSVVTTDGSSSALNCTISAAETDCREAFGSTTDVAAGATVAIRAVMVSNNSDDNAWCMATIALR